MYKILIDYSGKLEIGLHWYGNFDSIILPKTPQSEKCFYNIFSLSLKELPINLKFKSDRIYLPHYFDSDLILEDLFFSIENNEIFLLNDLNAKVLEIYDDFVDHKPRAVTFEKIIIPENNYSSDDILDNIHPPFHFLGENPIFVQPDGHVLNCIDCSKEMKFLLQFGSDSNLNAEFDDGGIAYYWYCEDCEVIGCRIESC